jgi:nucleotide-binding universal stress UspA family protein
MDTDVSEPKIVPGVDGSTSSHDALRWAVRYAGLVGGTVHAVAVWELPGLGRRGPRKLAPGIPAAARLRWPGAARERAVDRQLSIDSELDGLYP